MMRNRLKTKKRHAFLLLELLLAITLFALCSGPLLSFLSIAKDQSIREKANFEQWVPFAFLHFKSEICKNSETSFIFNPKEHYSNAKDLCFELNTKTIDSFIDTEMKKNYLIELEITCKKQKATYTLIEVE